MGMKTDERKPKPTTGNEQGPRVVVELTDLRPGQTVEGPARCERKRPPR